MNYLIKIASFISQNKIDTLISTLMNISIILVAIWTYNTFKYKADESIRKLYISNSMKLKEVYSFFLANAKIDNDNLNKLSEILCEAELYLHKDIVKHINDFRVLAIKLQYIETKLDGTNVPDEREKYSKDLYKVLVEMGDIATNYRKLYRKQIVNDGLIPGISDKFEEFKKKFTKKDNLNEDLA